MSDTSEFVLHRTTDPKLFLFWCPGCEYGHHLTTGPDGWKWNGDMVKPTVRPSLLINAAGLGPSPRCHFFMKDGQLQFLNDCTHSLKALTVDMVPWDQCQEDS